MVFLSELIGRPVTDIDGKVAGSLQDVIAKSWTEFPHPVVEAVVVGQKTGSLIVAYDSVAALTPSAILLKNGIADARPYTPGETCSWCV